MEDYRFGKSIIGDIVFDWETGFAYKRDYPKAHIPDKIYYPYEYVVYKENNITYAKNCKTGEIEYYDKDSAGVINSVVDNYIIAIIGDYEISETIDIPAGGAKPKIIYLRGTIKKASSFSGTELIKINNQRVKIVGGQINGVDKSVDGILMTGSIGYWQQLIGVDILSCDTGIKITHEPDGINYLGFILNPHIRDVNTGILIDGSEVHVLRIVDPIIWSYNIDGIVIRNSPKSIVIDGGLLEGGVSTSIDGIRVESGSHIVIKSSYIEHFGEGYAINIESEADGVEIDYPCIPTGRVKLLGHVMYKLKYIVEQLDDLMLDVLANITTSGSASYSILCIRQGALKLATGTTANSTAEYRSKIGVYAYGDFPVAYIRFNLGDTADVKVNIGLYASPSNYALIKYDPTTSANWIAEVNKGGTITNIDTGITPDTDWHELRIQLNTAKGITFFVLDSSLLASISSVPTGACISPYAYIENLAAADKNITIDYVKMLYARY